MLAGRRGRPQTGATGQRTRRHLERPYSYFGDKRPLPDVAGIALVSLTASRFHSRTTSVAGVASILAAAALLTAGYSVLDAIL